MLTAVQSINPGIRAFVMWLVLYSLSMLGIDFNLMPFHRFLLAIGLTTIGSALLWYYLNYQSRDRDKQKEPRMTRSRSIDQMERQPKEKKRSKRKATVTTLDQAKTDDITVQVQLTHHIDQLVKAEDSVEFNFSKSGTRVIQ